ncbi:ABC transporter substrate-binding protein [Streptomyces cucumeris]|uniref:ABC transporter substrate-binding protein n=1 Tax=Streptomyces cucumeris TaxID=2962890 RepID=UPI0020C8A84C|nr:ABC transporter substrate-binding protein [Streptomyces sp. NEAU-Y11]MCP9211564.1 ABC transporter substrate-binding protein [Streptomyces sp. NEAU-Y11]
MPVKTGPPFGVAVTLILTGSVLITGCRPVSDTGSAGRPVRVAADDELAAMVPPHLKKSGTLTIATDASYAPMEYKEPDGTIVGVDIDLGKAIAGKLGLRADFQNAKFDGIIGGIQARKYDLSMSSFTATKEREKSVDMVTYFSAGLAVAVNKGNPKGIDPDRMCGVKVAVQTGSVSADDIKDRRNPECEAKGRPAIPGDGHRFELQTDVTTALIARRDDAMISDSSVVAYAVKQSGGQIQQLGTAYAVDPSGIVVPKGDGRLTEAVRGAVQALIDDGTYTRILTRWGVNSGAIKRAAVNAATH